MKKQSKMSKLHVDSDGFQVVKSKNSSKFKHTKLPSKALNFKKQESKVDVQQSISRITSILEEFSDSQYHKDATKSVSKLLNDKQVVEIVCFGLGQISECNIAKHQLAFLLSLKALSKPQKVLAHDPIFYRGECEVLKHFGIEIIPKNEEGSYAISDEGITLVYLPHCPKQLTNNFLWSNWGLKLQNCMIICNSFNSLFENNPNRILQQSVPYITKIQPYICEVVLENNFKFTDIFNDTSIHYFPKENLDKTSSDFWTKADKPFYSSNSEEFITSLMVETLNI